MLTKSFIDAAKSVAHLWTSHGFEVTPGSNTPIEHLVYATAQQRATIPVSEISEHDPDQERFDQLGHEIEQATTPNFYETIDKTLTPHSRILDDKVKTYSEVVAKTAYVVRNHVIPLVAQLHDETVRTLEQHTPVSILNTEIVVNDLPDLVRLPEFLAQVNINKEVAIPETITAGLGIPALEETEILDRLKTGIASIDSEVTKWVERVGVSRVMRVFNRVFLSIKDQVATDNDVHAEATAMLYRDSDRFFNCTIAFLLASSFYHSPVEGTKTAPGEYGARLVDLRAVVGSEIHRVIRGYANKVDSGILVDRYENNRVVVFQHAYDRFLDEGGTNEMLLGSLTATNRSHSLSKILENGVELEKNWSRRSAMAQADVANQRSHHQRRVLAELFRSQVSEDLSDIAGTDVRGMQDYMNQFSTLYNQFSKAELDDLYSLCVKIVCRIRFPGSQYESILLDIDAIAKRSPELCVRDCATLAFVNYVSRWLADMICVKAPGLN